MDNFSKFQATLKTTIQKLEGVACLIIPREIMALNKSDPNITDKEIMKLIENTCKTWLSQVINL